MVMCIEQYCDFCTKYETTYYNYHSFNICNLCYKLYVNTYDFETKSDSSGSISTDDDTSDESIKSVEIN